MSGKSDQYAMLNNQRLFDAYAKKLGSCDVSSFTDVTEKLATWLDNPKAYYKAARHEIIKLLMIALSTVRRAVGAMDPAKRFHVSRYAEHPLVPPYAKLVQVVRQYMNFFVESELADQIRYLVSTVNLPPATNSQEFHTAALLSEQAPVQAPRTLAASSVAAPHDTTPAKVEALASSSPSSESAKMGSTNAPIQGAPQRIKRKRKTLEQLVDVDQRKLRENMASARASLTPKEFKEFKEPGSEELTNVAPYVNADSRSVSEPRLLEVAVSPSSMPMDVTVGHSTPSRTSSVDRTNITDGKTTNTTAHPLQVEGHCSTSVKLEEDQQPHNVVTDFTSADAAQLVSTNAESKAEIPSDPQADAECAQSVANSVQAGTLTSSEPVVQDSADMPAASGEVVQSNEDDSMDVEIVDEQLVGGRAIPDGDEMELDHELQMQGQVVEKLQEIHDRISQYASQMPLPCEDLSSTISEIIDQEEVVSEDTKTADRQVNIPTEQDPKVENSDHIEEIMHQEKEFVPGPDMNAQSLVHPSLLMVKVPALVRGLSDSGKVAISFEIKPGIHAALSRWARRDTPSTEVANAICITLGCYWATEEGLKVVEGKKEWDWRCFVSSHPSSWPETGSLQLSFTAGDCCTLPLSPPFTVTPDNLFDLSHLLVLGANEFELQFSQDLSKYLFALIIHPPTPGQLAGRSDRYKKEQDWKNWVHDLSQPFRVDPTSLLHGDSFRPK